MVSTRIVGLRGGYKFHRYFNRAYIVQLKHYLYSLRKKGREKKGVEEGAFARWGGGAHLKS